jgi:tetratricopeptide (TPR) repeat protein
MPIVAWMDAAAWALLLGLTVWLLRGDRRWFTWWIAGLILLLPSSSIFPAADVSADRRMYLPMFAFAALAALLLARVRYPALLAAVALVLLAISVQRTMVWMTEESLWREAVEHAPKKLRPKLQLARALPAAKGLEVLAKARLDAPYEPAIATETGKILLNEGQADGALEEFGRALALAPMDARNMNNRGVALLALGQTEAARADFQRALRTDPRNRLSLQSEWNVDDRRAMLRLAVAQFGAKRPLPDRFHRGRPQFCGSSDGVREFHPSLWIHHRHHTHRPVEPAPIVCRDAPYRLRRAQRASHKT